jgi:hypothetical protein
MISVNGVFDVCGVIVKMVTYDKFKEFKYDIILDSNDKGVLEKLNSHKDEIMALSTGGIDITMEYFNDNTLKEVHVVTDNSDYKNLVHILTGVIIGLIK